MQVKGLKMPDDVILNYRNLGCQGIERIANDALRLVKRVYLRCADAGMNPARRFDSKRIIPIQSRTFQPAPHLSATRSYVGEKQKSIGILDETQIS